MLLFIICFLLPELLMESMNLVIGPGIVQNERGSTQIECEVVAAKDDALIGRTHTEYLKWPKAEYSETGNRIAKEQLLAWCFAAKTTSPEEIKARQQARQGFDAGWLSQMVGRHVLGFVKIEQYTSSTDGSEKSTAKCEGRVWSIDNPKGKGIPGWVDVAGQPIQGAGQTQAAPSAASAAPAATAAAGNDPFGGLV